MNVRNCNRCGRIFNYVTGQPICVQCKKELEVSFKAVRLFIRRNPAASIQSVAEECGVETKQLRQWIREERLCFSKDSGVGIECEKCGKTILTGRFCEACKNDTMSDLRSVSEPKTPPPVEKEQKQKKRSQMHFMHKDK